MKSAAALRAPEVDVEPRAEAIALALADFNQPARPVCERGGVDSFGHEDHACGIASNICDHLLRFGQGVLLLPYGDDDPTSR